MFSFFTPWCLASSPTRLPSGYPYRFEYFQALVIAFITDSGGPQQFSLLERCANESQSSLPMAGRPARAAGCVPGCCANRSASGFAPRYPTAAATPPMNFRRETLMEPPSTQIAPILARIRTVRRAFRPSVSGPASRPLVLVPPDRAAGARADEVYPLVAVDVRTDTTVHRLVVDLAVGPLARRRIRRGVKDVDAASRRVGIPRARIAVVVRDHIVSSVTVEVHYGDFMAARHLVVDHTTIPFTVFLDVDHDLVAVPRFHGRQEPLAILRADAHVARAEPRRFFDMAGRQQPLGELHVVAAARRPVQRDPLEARHEKLFALAAIPLHGTHPVNDA